MSEILHTDERVPCAIAAMDIVSYSREFDEIQERMVERLNGLVRSTLAAFDLVDDAICLPTGDGAFIVFVGRTSALALEFVRRLSGQIRDEHAIMPLRAGIHEGAVKVIRDVAGHPNVVGTSVNIAARVMDLGDAGSILVSEQAHATLATTGKFADGLKPLTRNPVEVKHGLLLNVYRYSDNQVGVPEEPTRLRRDIGVRASAIGRDVDWTELMTTDKRLRITDLSMPLFGVPQLLDELEALIARGTEIQVLLCSPVSSLVCLRRDSCAYDSTSELETTLEYVIKILIGFRERLTRNCGASAAQRFEVRLHHAAAPMSAVINDERAYVSFYVEHLSGSRGPFFTVAGRSSLYECVSDTFDYVWGDRSDDLYASDLAEQLASGVRARREWHQNLVVPPYLS